MPEHKNSNTPVLDDEGVSREDLFRRATFNWALSTKKMVETAAALGNSIRVARTALADMEYARDLIDKLYVPSTVKGTIASAQDFQSPITAAEVKESVSGLVRRVATEPCCGSVASLVQAHVDDIVGAPPIVRGPVSRGERTHRGIDWSAPVHSKNGKMLWAGVDCPTCPSKASQRCQKDDGGFVEKPHPARKVLAEQA